MLWLILGLIGFCGIAGAQNTANFPTTLADHDDLLVMVNAGRTTLASSLTDSATSITVADGSVFFSPGANEAGVIAIGSEYIKYCTIAGNTVTVCSGGRGFDDSTAAAHAANVAVVGIYLASHHNQMAAEIVAIEAEILRCSVTSELTISSGSITIPGTGCYSVDTEADAASDALTSFVCAAGVRFRLFPASDARTVVITQGSGLIEGPANFSMDNSFDMWEGWCRSANVAIEQDRSNGGA